ncbi:MAG: hypothetical protein Terrestrivirus4_98 [Terrestrivirus sp.]|uniref:Uncharacterized protein n=1 Tax=Terrestrivirus sp. TaxID=2487775 RepID=A0A3G4ZMH3_9VIRU|nr:MAG: hypothetical protein Terrestrivirus4_98 [Terrestrivirus sp.]
MDPIDFEEINHNIVESPANIDMTFPRMPHDDITVSLRFCASSKSIPVDAFNVLNLWGSVNGEKQDTFNNSTGLPHGFSYNIKKTHDKCFVKRKIEKDISFNRYFGKNNFNNSYYDNCNNCDNYDDEDFIIYMKYNQRNNSYDNFVKYYDDEEFEERKEISYCESDHNYSDNENISYGSYVSSDPYKDKYSDNELDYVNQEPILVIDYDLDIENDNDDYS